MNALVAVCTARLAYSIGLATARREVAQGTNCYTVAACGIQTSALSRWLLSRSTTLSERAATELAAHRVVAHTAQSTFHRTFFAMQSAGNRFGGTLGI